MSKKKRNRVILAIVVGGIISLIVGYSYSAEQTRIKGFNFGNNLQEIQEDLKNLETQFQSEITIYQEGDSSSEELLVFSEKHFSDLEELILRYDNLEPPETFVASVDLFKLSSQSQLEADKATMEWVLHDDDSAKIRSESFTQEAFEYELSALAKFNAAKVGIAP